MAKSIILILLLIIACTKNSDLSKGSRKIDNLRTFAKIYGYVKYFHPSDEASELNWNKFASYGASRVLTCKTDEELIKELRYIFKPIAPSVIFTTESNSSYDVSEIKPSDPANYNLTFWQHKGLGMGMNADFRSPYKSARVNSPIRREEPINYGLLTNSLNTEAYRGKRLRFQLLAKLADTSGVSAYIRLAFINSDGSITLEKKDITNTDWAVYEIESRSSEMTKAIEIGAALKGNTSLLLDNAELSFWNGKQWEMIPLINADFDQGDITGTSLPIGWLHRGDGYLSVAATDVTLKSQGSAKLFRHISEIEFEKKLFEREPEFGEFVNEQIGSSIFCRVPVVLYTNEEGTFPRTDSLAFLKIQNEIDSMTSKTTELDVRLGNIINSYNVFQHFYPYMDVVDVDWEKQLVLALSRSFEDSSATDHYVTLEKFTAPLMDGHIYVNFSGIKEIFAPGITWEWIEGKLVITNVLDSKTQLKIGDEVTHVDGLKSKDYFKEINSRVSAGTDGWLDFKAKRKGLLGEYEKPMVITVNGVETTLDRLSLAYNEPPRQAAYDKMNDSIYYLNLSLIEMDTITGILPELMKTKAIICDLRGYPNRNHMFISHLLKNDDTSASWMQIPKIIYPNQKSLVGYEEHGWFLPSKAPYLGDKQIIFLTDGRAISYAESFMGFIEGFDLATIIGQPTAGTNGNINTFELAGGFSITWTGMKVLKHDGSQHHAIGITPDIYVSKTIEGIKAGRDEVLEKAIELINH
tara:strand:- start:3552 stop:5801 length:2250 start_codon:yes stop_codon:yes gene_type:complete